MSKPRSLADELSIWGFEDDHLIFDDGSLGFVLSLTPVDITCFSDDSIDQLKSKISQFLNSIPAGSDLQFVSEVGYGNQSALDEHETLGGKANNNAAKAIVTDRIEKLRIQDQEGNLPKYRLYLFFRKLMSQALVDKPKWFSRQKRYESVSQERLSNELTSLARIKRAIEQELLSMGLRPEGISSKNVMDLLYGQWNPSRKNALIQYDPSDVRSSLLFTDLGLLDRGFLIGDTEHRVVSLKRLPDQTFSGMARTLQGLPQGSRLFLTIHVPDQTQEIESLQRNRRVAYSMARGKRSGVADLESEAKLQDIETLLEQMIAQGEKVFRVSMNVLLRSKNASELDDHVASTITTIRSLSGAEAMEETLASYFVFREFALPNARATERAKRVKTSNLADILSIYGPWQGMTRPSILLRSAQGTLLKFDPFDSELTNANQLISGGSGAGKSFLTNILLMQALKENPRIFFVDIGGSYKKICENLGGEYIPLGMDSGLSINTFDLLQSEEVPSSQKIKFLLGLVELMTKEDDTGRLPKLERAEIERCIQSLYDSNRKPRLSDLKNALLSHPDAEISRYGRILNSWCGDTPFGRFIDRETNIDVGRPLVAFDLKGLESYPDLQSVCLFIITDLVWREVQRDRQTTKFLVFDECWKLLKSDSGLVFIEEVFRTFRKYRASAIAISQDIDDFAKSKISTAILPNCSVKWILMQPQIDSVRLNEVLGLNENEIALVKGLIQEKGKFSQAFLIAQKNKTVAVIDSTPIEYWIATTDPRDLAEIDKIAAECPDHIARLKFLAQKYPSGVAAFGSGG